MLIHLIKGHSNGFSWWWREIQNRKAALMFEWRTTALRSCHVFSPSECYSFAVGPFITGREKWVCPPCDSALPVTGLMSKRDVEDLGISMMIRSVSPSSACDLSRSKNKYAQAFLWQDFLSSLNRDLYRSPPTPSKSPNGGVFLEESLGSPALFFYVSPSPHSFH